jgi:hypothetical protein
VVLGKPLYITLTLVIFEMLRKGFLQQVSATPFVVEVAEGFRTHGSGLSTQARGERRRKAAQAINAALHKYEEPYLELIESNPGVPVTELDFGVAVQPLVRYVAGRVGGFNLQETRDYYRLLVDRAPREARSDGKLTFERQRVFDRNFGMVLLGDDFVSVLDQTDYSYVPVWQRQTPFPTLPLEEEVREVSNVVSPSFAQWAKGVMASMAGSLNEKDVKLNLGSETDAVTARLMNEIARATFFG